MANPIDGKNPNNNENDNLGNSNSNDEAEAEASSSIRITDDSNKILNNEDALPVFNDKCRSRQTDQPRVIESTAIAIVTPTTPTNIVDSSSGFGQEYPEPLLDSDDPEFVDRPPDALPFEDINNPLLDDTLSGINVRQPLSRVSSNISGPLKAINYHLIRDRASLIQQLTRTFPENEYGLPPYLYRPDLLDPTHFNQVPSVEEARYLQNFLSAAVLDIFYNQGFPTFDSGLPIWTQLAWESAEAYQVFCEYIEQDGIRSLHNLQGIAVEESLEWHSINYWNIRAKSYDLYRAAHLQRRRIQRVIASEDNHYEIAGKLLSKVTKRIKEFDDSDMADMDPKVAAEVLERLVKIQRISLGMPGNGVLTDDKNQLARTPMSVELSMRRIATATTDGQKVTDDLDIDILRDSPESAELAQELILRIAQGKS